MDSHVQHVQRPLASARRSTLLRDRLQELALTFARDVIHVACTVSLSDVVTAGQPREVKPGRGVSFPQRVHQTVEAWRERYGLSVSQADILERAVLGEGQAAIAAARASSPFTVKKHVAQFLPRTGDHSLQEAVARLLRELAQKSS